MPQLSRNRRAWIVILTAALVLRVVAAIWWHARLGDERFYFGDSQSYWDLARAIARGEPYQYLTDEQRVFRTPGYPLVLSIVFLLGGDDPPVLAARILSALLGTLAVGIAGWWATRLFDERAGRIAGWITALYPGGVALSVFVLSEAPFCPLMLAHLACWSRAAQTSSHRRRWFWAAGAGTAAALATLARPSWLLFTPFALLVAVTFFAQRVRYLALGAMVTAALILGMIPWWIRNANAIGRFVPTTLQVGASLYDGLHPGATGASDMRFVPEVTARERANPSGDAAFEVRLDQRMWNEAVAFARDNPAEALKLAGTKFLRMWNVWPNERGFQNWFLRLLVLAGYVPLLALGLAGTWRYRHSGFACALAWLPAVYLTLLHVVFVGSIRYREPAMLALAVLAAGVLAGAAPKQRLETNL